MTPLVLPLAALLLGAAVAALRRRPAIQAATAAGGLAALAVAGVLFAIAQPTTNVAWGPAIELAVDVSGFGRVMVVLVPAVAAPVVAYGAVTETRGRTRLLALLCTFVAAMLLLVMARDFVSLLIAWELVGAISWALIGHDWSRRDNVSAATQAFVTTRLGDLGLYVAAGAAFGATGSFRFDSISAAGSPWVELIAAGVLLAAAAKSAQLPFSPWLFAAMAGPTPVSALLHSATLVAAGAYLLIRLEPMLAAVPWFLPAVGTVGLVTALAAGVLASAHSRAKPVLAASTSAQYGLMLVAIGTGSVAAAGAQLVAHAVFKSLLFLLAGIGIHAAGTTEIRRWRLGRALPAFALLMAVATFALAGLPPIGAAWSKEAILASAVESGGILAILTFAAAAMSALYAARFGLLAAGRDGTSGIDRPGRHAVASAAVLALGTLALSALWLPGAGMVVTELTEGRLVPGAPWETAASIVLVLAAMGGAWWLDQRRRLADIGVPRTARPAVENWLGVPVITSRLIVRPVLTLSSALAQADDRVIDAGVHGAARIGAGLSRLAARRIDVSVDGLVHALAAATVRAAGSSRAADDRLVDRTVEATGRAVGVAGHHSRRLQTGQSHHYFVILGVGLIAIVSVLAFGR